MVSPRLRCICCALPARVLEHVAAKTGGDHAARMADHHRHSETIRAQRHAKAAEPQAQSAAGQRRRIVFDAAHKQDLPGRLIREEGDAAKAHDDAVSGAYDNVGITLDFYAKVFGRDSLDGRGMDVNASVHYGDRFSNAMWNGTQMVFGDGDGVHIRGFTQSLDIVAHELTHAVTQHAIPGGLGVIKRHGKFDLTGEAGALNESISDVFACLVKQWHKKQKVDEADWLLGEGILAPALGRAVRSLKSPGNTAETYEGDDQVPDMRGYEEGGDVHRNSGIPNHAFYLAAHALGGHAWEHAGRIWYESIPRLQSQSGFRAAAQVTVDVAARVFGAASKEHHAIEAAWRKVGVLAA
jgi:Zn-dependent metalloprotease